MNRTFHAWIVGVLFGSGLVVAGQMGPVAMAAAPGSGSETSSSARLVVERAQTSQGLCVVFGCDDAEFVLALARASDFLIHALDRRADAVAALRKAVDAAGLYGNRVVVEQSGLRQLPHADNTIDVIVARPSQAQKRDGLPHPEVMRVLRPGGVAIHFGVPPKGGGVVSCTSKPPVQGVDDWSHWEHGPDNNPVSTDTVIRAPYMTQWLGTPLYITMPSITTAAGGRIFLAMGHIAHHVREEPWLNTLLARNGYNGARLWQRKLPDGYLAHRSAFIATDDVFYMIDNDGSGCLLLDPQTGRETGRVHLPGHPGEWKWIALADGKLFALIGQQKDPAETTVVRSQFGHWSWGELSKGYYQRRVPWGFGTKILAYDLKGKKVVWMHEEKAPVDSRAMVLGGGHVYFYAPDAHVGCLDAKSGKVSWTNSDAEVRKLIEEPGRGLKSTPGFKTTCYCLYTPKALFYEAQTRMNIVAISKKDGHVLWHRRKTTNNPNTLYTDGHLFVGIGKNGSTLMLDPMTGKTIKDLKFGKRSCARLTATPDSLFCRGMPEGLTRYDRKTGKVLFNGAVRPACNDGVVPANGLLYIGPWTCDCNLSLMGRLVLCSSGDFKFNRSATEAERLQTGQGDTSKVAPFEVTGEDWSTYRGSTARGASTPVSVPRMVKRLWSAPVCAGAPTAPTAAGGLVFVCDGKGKVHALDAKTGRSKWTFLTAGPIIQPPTVWNSRAYVGSGDGYVYVLSAATGRMLWRFRAAPVERRIMVYDSLCSTWPVNSGVLVADGVAYAAAGIIDYDGTYVYALDAVTGKIKWQNNTSGHLSKELRKGASAQGFLTIHNDLLRMPAGNVVNVAGYRVKDGRYVGDLAGNGSPRANRGEEVGVFKKRCLISGGRLRYSATENVVNPGAFTATSLEHGNVQMPLCYGKIPPAWNDDRIVFASGRNSTVVCCQADAIKAWLGKRNPKTRPETAWAAQGIGQTDTVSLAIASNAILVVCEAKFPRALRKRVQIFALRPRNGTVIWKQNLSAPALPGGLLVDRDGRIVVVLANGTIECFGKIGPA